MASFTYFSCMEDLARGAIDFDTDSFKILLVTSSYTPSQSGHSKRSDVNANEVSGTGYSAGGPACTITPSRVSGVVSLTVSSPTLAAPVSGFTARYAIIYKTRGGAASADELVALIDPTGGAVAANGTSFTISVTGAITITTPTA